MPDLRTAAWLAALTTAAACGTPSTQGAATAATSPAHAPMDLYSLETNSLDGAPASLANYRGKVTLVVNVASECGYTPQYAGLQKLHREWRERGFAVLGFPCNDFGGQEPGSPEQIQKFCSTNYGVDFPLFAKVKTKPGPDQSPVYAMLEQATGKLPNWNFCKYLVAKDGTILGFFPSRVAPDSKELQAAIEAAIAQ